jgi:hypothetical protein
MRRYVKKEVSHFYLDCCQPSGSVQDVAQAQRVVDRIPGTTDAAANMVFTLFKDNYQSRVAENHMPASLRMSDVPANIAGQTAH